METDVWRISVHSALFGLRRDVRRGFLRLACGQDWAPQRFPDDGAEIFDRHRHFDFYTGQRLAVPGHIPFPDRIWRGRPVLRGPSARAGVCARFKTRNGWRPGNSCRPSRRPYGRGTRRVRDSLRGLARPFCDRNGSWAAHPIDPGLGAGITTVADPDGTNRGGAQVAGMGVRNGSRRPSARRAGGAEAADVPAVGYFPIPKEPGGLLDHKFGRANRLLRAYTLGSHFAGATPVSDAGEGVLPADLRESCRPVRARRIILSV